MKKIILVLMALLMLGVTSAFALERCPRCGGPLTEVERGHFLGQYTYTCINGHRTTVTE